jgi:hypothetical protein
MAHGRWLAPFESLADIRARAESQLARLPKELRSLDSTAHPYSVKIAPALKSLAREADALTAELPALVR